MIRHIGRSGPIKKSATSNATWKPRKPFPSLGVYKTDLVPTAGNASRLEGLRPESQSRKEALPLQVNTGSDSRSDAGSPKLLQDSRVSSSQEYQFAKTTG